MTIVGRRWGLEPDGRTRTEWEKDARAAIARLESGQYELVLGDMRYRIRRTPRAWAIDVQRVGSVLPLRFSGYAERTLWEAKQCLVREVIPRYAEEGWKAW